jgi:hypothetical protein
MVKQVYINGEFTKEQLERAARIGLEARREAFVKDGRGNIRKAMAQAEVTGLEAALDALTDMWTEGER